MRQIPIHSFAPQVDNLTLSYRHSGDYSKHMTKSRRKNDIRANMTQTKQRLDAMASSKEKKTRSPAPWYPLFLAGLRAHKTVAGAARNFGISHSGVYHARKNDLVFRADWDFAIATANLVKDRLSQRSQRGFYLWDALPEIKENYRTVQRQKTTVQLQNSASGSELDLTKLDSFTRDCCEKLIKAGKGRELKKISESYLYA